MARKKHKDVDFAVDDAGGNERIFKTWDEAAAFAVAIAASRGHANLDVLIHSRAGAKWYGGDEAVAQYKDDPDASVSDRLEITVNPVGRVY